jgi:endonuclease G
MKNRVVRVVLIFQLWSLFSFSQNYLPTNNGELIEHTCFTLSYIEEHEQAEWVCYKLLPEMFMGTAKRTNNFRSDVSVSSNSAALSDYYKTGYDRGHLVPAGDMRIYKQSMSETFLLSNVTPQVPSFNRDIWLELENLTRSWCVLEKELIVVAGGVFHDNIGVIGENKVTVPGYYYKVIYAPISQKMIGFVIPNKATDEALSSFVLKVDFIEVMTNINFFFELEDTLEKRLESSLPIANWNFDEGEKNKGVKEFTSNIANRCLGLAKSTENQCKNPTKNRNTYCHLHEKQAPNYIESKSTN